ncbi:hypothetical protein E3N88_42085 [Mikania micrantha]|uniref:Uncharacterized protein n=1 Tax=Mikania micrantha TaxID=192012 RepID=A0A5N6LJL1_9ASTR|nr:hypothetical protein E3N88_42085 [Mikania micrantha]
MHFPPRQEPVTDSSKFTAADVRVTDQKLRVCDICGAFLSVYDSDRRLADHFGGKLHLGYMQIREKLADLMEERNNKRKASEDDRRSKERSKDLEREGSRDRDRASSRDRDRTRDSDRRSETVIGITIVVVVMTAMIVIEKETGIQGTGIDQGHDQGTVSGIMIDQGVMIGTSKEADERSGGGSGYVCVVLFNDSGGDGWW